MTTEMAMTTQVAPLDMSRTMTVGGIDIAETHSMTVLNIETENIRARIEDIDMKGVERKEGDGIKRSIVIAILLEKKTKN